MNPLFLLKDIGAGLIALTVQQLQPVTWPIRAIAI